MGTRASPALRSSVVPEGGQERRPQGFLSRQGLGDRLRGGPAVGHGARRARGGFLTGECPKSDSDRRRHLPVPPRADSRGSRVGVCAPSKTKIKDHISQESKTGGPARRDKPPAGGRGASGHPGCSRREGQGGQRALGFWGRQACRKRLCDGRGRAGVGVRSVCPCTPAPPGLSRRLRRPSGPVTRGLLCTKGAAALGGFSRPQRPERSAIPGGFPSFVSWGYGGAQRGLRFPVDAPFSVPGKPRLGHFLGSDQETRVSAACLRTGASMRVGAGGWGLAAAGRELGAHRPRVLTQHHHLGAKPCSPRLGLELSQ